MAQKRIVNVGLIQTAVSEDLDANLAMTLTKVSEAADQGAQIVCLQELYRTPYFPVSENIDAARFSETVPGKSTEAFTRLAKDRDIVIIVPLYERTSDGKFFNSAAVIDADGALLPTYRKIHIPQDPYFYEKNYFEPGDSGVCVYRTKYANFSVLICFDQWYPEAARIATLQGADIIFYPTAIGYIRGHVSEDGDWHDAWRTVQRGHAIANGSHVCAVNRVGVEGELEFWGGSFACDSFGKVLLEAGAREQILVVPLDLSHNERIREGWGFLRNRRPDAYNPICLKKDTSGEHE